MRVGLRVSLVLVVTLATTAGCREGLKQSKDGAVLFDTACVQCHGSDGKGTDYARRWNVPDFTTPAFQAKTDAELLGVIKQGRNQMPPWGGVFKDDQIAALLVHVRGFGGKR